MGAKYTRDIAHASLSTVRQSDSRIWRRMLRAKDTVIGNTHLLVRDGSSSFWFENWLGEGLLGNDLAGVPTPETRLPDFSSAGSWRLETSSPFVFAGHRAAIQQFTLSTEAQDELE